MLRLPTLGAPMLLVCLTLEAGAQPPPGAGDFPPTTAKVSLAVKVGEQVTVGGPQSDNFLPNTTMDVFVVPHRIWRDGDALGASAVQRVRARSNAKGQLLLTQVWKTDKPGRFDIIVDYDGDGRFSCGLDAIHAIDVRPAR